MAVPFKGAAHSPPDNEMTDWIALGTFLVELIGLGFIVESRLRAARRAGRKSLRLVLPESPYYDKRRGIDTDRFGNKAWEIRWLLRAATIGLMLFVVSLTAFWTEILLTFPLNNPLSGEGAIPFSLSLAVGCIVLEITGVGLMWFS